MHSSLTASAGNYSTVHCSCKTGGPHLSLSVQKQYPLRSIAAMVVKSFDSLGPLFKMSCGVRAYCEYCTDALARHFIACICAVSTDALHLKVVGGSLERPVAWSYSPPAYLPSLWFLTGREFRHRSSPQDDGGSHKWCSKPLCTVLSTYNGPQPSLLVGRTLVHTAVVWSY